MAAPTVSVEQAAANALATWLQTGLGADVVVSQRWPEASKSLPGPPTYKGAVTVLLAGDRQDELTPLPASEEMAGLIPGADLVVVEDSGHLSTMEQPEAVNAALAAWLGRLAG